MTPENKYPAGGQKNLRLEQALADIEQILTSRAEPVTNCDPERSTDPLFVVGVGRSGSTLLMQFLAASGQFAYPSNIISRFYMNPALGELVQNVLLNPDLDPNGQFSDLQNGLRDISFDSDLGKTATALSPNEFWYFWRRFFDFEGTRPAPEGALLNDSGFRFRNDLADWSQRAGKPVALKATIAVWNLNQLVKLLPEARVLVIVRDPIETMIALLNARLRFWGEISGWYGLQLPPALTGIAQDPIEEVALQVAAFDEFVETKLDMAHIAIIDYATFCNHPAVIWESKALRRFGSRGRIDLEEGRNRLKAVKFEPRTAFFDPAGPLKDLQADELQSLYHRFRSLLKKDPAFG